MSLVPTRWLIELGPAFLREPLYLHVFEDESCDWSADKTLALRFASRQEAERFGFDHIDEDFIASEQPAADLVGPLDHDETEDDPVCTACGLAGCASATCELSRRRAERRAKALS